MRTTFFFKNCCSEEGKEKLGKRQIFYKVMAFPVLLYGTKTWVLKSKDRERIEEAEMKFERIVESCTKTDQSTNDKKWNYLVIFPSHAVAYWLSHEFDSRRGPSIFN
jgi:hypothetical protein